MTAQICSALRAALGRGRCRASAGSLGRADERHAPCAARPSTVARRRRSPGSSGRTDSGTTPQRRDLGDERFALLPASAAARRTAGATRPRAGASRRARRRCTGGSGRSPRWPRTSPTAVSATMTPSSPGGRLDGRRWHDRLDLRHPHEVAHRDDADELAVVDHGDVAVAVLAELVRTPPARTRRDRRESGSSVIHSLTLVPLASAPDGVEAHEVALGQDADGTFAVDDDDRADASGHACGSTHRPTFPTEPQ